MNNTRNWKSAFIVGSLLAGSTQAATLTFNFTGTVSTILQDDSSGTFGANFAVGNPVIGSFSFDPAVPSISSGPDLEVYPANLTVSINGKVYTGASQYRIFNNAGLAGDGFSVINEDGTFTGPVLGSLIPRTLFAQFLGMPVATLADTSIVTNPDAIYALYDPNYAPHGFRLDNSSNPNDWGGLYYTISSFSAVPDTGGYAVLALGGLSLALARRIKRGV